MYQVSVHRDPPEKVTKSQFKRFLCNSSLFHESNEEDEDASRGAFHMQVHFWMCSFAFLDHLIE